LAAFGRADLSGAAAAQAVARDVQVAIPAKGTAANPLRREVLSL
jgi:hypothetical protein